MYRIVLLRNSLRWTPLLAAVAVTVIFSWLAVAVQAAPPNPEKLSLWPKQAHKVTTEYVELPRGGHGLNGYKGPMWDAWQTKSLEWLAAQKIIPAGDSSGSAKSGY